MQTAAVWWRARLNSRIVLKDLLACAGRVPSGLIVRDGAAEQRHLAQLVAAQTGILAGETGLQI